MKKDNQLQFDRSCHVLYSKPCKLQIKQKIALHYPKAERESVWECVQRQYGWFLSDLRKDLCGKKNFHNGAGGNYDCIALMAYYVTCKEVTNLKEIEEMEGNLFLPALCNLDFEAMELIHAKLVRKTTCANGKKCDYTICGDRDVYPKEHPEYRDKDGSLRRRNNNAIYRNADGNVDCVCTLFPQTTDRCI